MADGEMTMAIEGPVPAAAEFTGRRGPLAKLLLKNTLLKILTLGIYRFWAKTSERRYFWSNVRVFGDPLEYTGLPSELFIGFLIVVAILVPFGIVSQGVATATQAAAAPIQIGINLAYYAVVFFLIQIAFYRMWRYRLTRTTWRGIRFGLDGSTWDYTVLAAKWTLLVVLTLGLAYPWMRIAMAEYRLGHSRFGATRFSFAGSGRDLLAVWIPANLGIFIFLAGSLWLSIQLAQTVMGGGAVDQGAPDGPSAPLAMINTVVVFPLAGLLFIWYRVRELRYMIGRVRFGKAGFKSGLSMSAVVVAGIMTFFVMFLVGVVIFIGATGLFKALDTGPSFGASVMLGVLGWIFMVFLFIAAWSVVVGLIFRYELTKAFCRTLEIDNPEALAEAVRSVDRGPARGEGLADVFDVGAF